ncbi:hypothetical protein ACFLSI_03560 [Bacteroidota bacterium]
MIAKFHFTFNNLEKQLSTALEKGYTFLCCKDYVRLKKENILPAKRIIFRVDIDLSVKKAERLGDIFKRLDINASFFIRLHAPEYNPFSFENYRIIKKLINNGNEIGYHSEVIDQSAIWNEDATSCLLRDIDIINRMFNIKISGVASHGGMTGLNNLDFWKDKKPVDFGLLYEGYDKEPDYNIFQEALYISDSEWTLWKSYNKGVLLENDRRSFEEHLADDVKTIHLLIHPDTYFNRHFYE